MKKTKFYVKPQTVVLSVDSSLCPLCSSPGDPYSGQYNLNPSMGWGDSGEQDF